MKEAPFLDTEEESMIRFIHEADYQPVEDMAAELAHLRTLAKETTAKKKAINIRLLESDLQKIKAKALREGIGYQTLIGSIIHKYANDRLAG